ncbi:MAG: RecQ family ATP-dependent DNA helicase, partial [Methanosarcinaceae archaeon]|nr:RecQ family ATP-dependent DNA helicase [Methanosarcinaceae archaeon]
MSENIELVAKEFFELNEQLKNLNKRKSELKTILFSAFDFNNIDEVHIEDMRVYRTVRQKVNWDEEKLKSILSPKGLWEQVLIVENRKVQDLIDNDLILESDVLDAKEMKDGWAVYTKRIPHNSFEIQCDAATKSESKKIMPIIITDLTRMHEDKVYIFGYTKNDFQQNVTKIQYNAIRPVIPYSGIREYFLFDKNGKQIIKPFTEIEFKFIQPLPNPPHIEDVEIDSNYLPRFIRNISKKEKISLLDEILDESVQNIFETPIHENRFILNENGKKSLGTVIAKEVKNVQYSIKDDGKYKYRITFSDARGAIYNLPITDCVFRKYYNSCRIHGKMNVDDIAMKLQQNLNQSKLYLSIGLTRVFKGVHWLQITGIHAFPDYNEIDCQKKGNTELIGQVLQKPISEQIVSVNTSASIQLARQALQKHFGYTSFLPLQEEIIENILSGDDVFVLMPTGGGKSLCYQLPHLLLSGITIVVSPLIALMKDQFDELKANGIAVAYINSTLSFDKINHIKNELSKNNIGILYVAPERIMLPNFLQFLKHLNINLIAIDEAHCISEWGHDFRPEYRQLKLLKELFPKTPLIALTATATVEVQKDIIAQLKLSNPKIHKSSLNRGNLFYQIKPKKNAYNQLLQYLKNHTKESGIIYCNSRKSTDRLASKLKIDGYRALPYHAGLGSNARTETQNKFIKDDIEIIVATIAFGMGID